MLCRNLPYSFVFCALLSLVGATALHAQYQSDAVLADFNNDQRIDMAIPDLSNVIIRMGNGDGTFQSATTLTIAPIGEYCTSIAAADFNGDGNVDLAVVCQGADVSQLIVLHGNGHGAFGRPIVYPTPDAGLLAVADLNQDGRPDLVEAGGLWKRGPCVQVFLTQPDGTFQRSGFTFPEESISAVAISDWNGDRIPDLALARGNGDVRIYLGRGDGTFRFDKEYVIQGPREAQMFLAVGDFSGDGRPDLLATANDPFPTNNPRSLFAFLYGDGDGAFQPALVVTGPQNGLAYGLVVADFDGDGRLDIAIANWSPSQISVFLGNGDGTFQTPSGYPAYSFTNLLLADLNGDGKPDILIEDAGISMLNQGDGTFKLVRAYP